MSNAAYSRAIAGYRATSQLALSPTEVALALHQKLYSAVASARSADEKNRLDEMVFHLGVASQIISALKLHMDFAAAGPDGVDLQRFYTRTQRAVRRIGMLPKRNREWSNVTDPIQNMVRSIINISRPQQRPENNSIQ
ncbi:flagellar protein FliS [Brevundimonas sp. SL130]|uniref:flagellar protein FliS n=1 Tax=Brevundimonas sp. SL130 TaxID=2995143 RepID=UPI00226D3C2B|nr:flagellar protein FliS [Brevundimonas sp. SL130]WAC60691.1 flagellar protein FliS [Brevundimonas sp. SL130]